MGADKDWETAKAVERLKRQEGERRLRETNPKELSAGAKPRTKNNGAGNWRN